MRALSQPTFRVLFLVGALCAATLAGALGQSSSTPQGFYQLTLEPGYQTVGVSLVNAATIEGTVASETGGVVSVSGSGSLLGSLFDTNFEYYLELVEGPGGTADEHVGQRFEVDVAGMVGAVVGGGEVVLNLSSGRNTLAGFPSADGYGFVVRRHMTLDQVFDGTKLWASDDFQQADQVQLFNGGGFTIYYVYGFNDGLAQWTGLTNFDSQDDLALLPGQGITFKRSALSPGVISLKVMGSARITPFVQPLVTGYNFVSEGFPSTTSFATRDAYPVGFADGDEAKLYNGGGFTTYQLFVNPDNVAERLWANSLDPNFTSVDGNELFDYRGAAFLRMGSAATTYRYDPPFGE